MGNAIPFTAPGTLLSHTGTVPVAVYLRPWSASAFQGREEKRKSEGGTGL